MKRQMFVATSRFNQLARMFSPQQYRLVDFGDGRKLEEFAGKILLSRPAPAADLANCTQPEAWSDAICYEREIGWAVPPAEFKTEIEHRGIKFLINGTPTGQVGVFPEQVHNWDWILDSCLDLEGLTAINLFGYTGGTTMALAKRGAHVTHLDAAQNVVAWARQNAAAAGLGEAPIRWIAEDAMRFLGREIKRGKRYDIVVADPPSFGRGPKNETWKIQRDLPELIKMLDALCGHQCKMAILSCHTIDFGARDLGQMVRPQFGLKKFIGEELNLTIPCSGSASRSLPSGSCFRFTK